jgi:DNA-binding NtrC family response regulator
LTGQGTIESAVEAMKLGAFNYLTKPFPLRDLEVAGREGRRTGPPAQRERTAQDAAGPQPAVGRHGRPSPALQEVFRLIERAGPSGKAILIQGESGTGKELVARALHRSSTRADKPLVVINCAALPETLLESELFGHEKGSFTGAVAAKPGLFEVADGGTLFIDEIGELPGSLQAKLLRVLEDGSLRRIGSIQERKVNVRLLAATNRNLAEEVKAGRFREDLYYRINVMSLELPPLRERAGDIPLLVRHFLGPNWQIEPEALAAMEAFRLARQRPAAHQRLGSGQDHGRRQFGSASRFAKGGLALANRLWLSGGTGRFNGRRSRIAAAAEDSGSFATRRLQQIAGGDRFGHRPAKALSAARALSDRG